MKFIDALHALFTGIDTLLRWLLTILLLFLFLILVYRIGARHVPFLPTMLWIEELSRFLFIWLIFLGGSLALIRREHFSINLFENFHGKRIDRVLSLTVNCILLSISLFFVLYSYDYMLFGLIQKSDYMQVNMGIFLYSSMFLSSVIWFSYLSFRLLLEMIALYKIF